MKQYKLNMVQETAAYWNILEMAITNRLIFQVFNLLITFEPVNRFEQNNCFVNQYIIEMTRTLKITLFW